MVGCDGGEVGPREERPVRCRAVVFSFSRYSSGRSHCLASVSLTTSRFQTLSFQRKIVSSRLLVSQAPKSFSDKGKGRKLKKTSRSKQRPRVCFSRGERVSRGVDYFSRWKCVRREGDSTANRHWLLIDRPSRERLAVFKGTGSEGQEEDIRPFGIHSLGQCVLLLFPTAAGKGTPSRKVRVGDGSRRKEENEGLPGLPSPLAKETGGE